MANAKPKDKARGKKPDAASERGRRTVRDPFTSPERAEARAAASVAGAADAVSPVSARPQVKWSGRYFWKRT